MLGEFEIEEDGDNDELGELEIDELGETEELGDELIELETLELSELLILSEGEREIELDGLTEEEIEEDSD